MSFTTKRMNKMFAMNQLDKHYNIKEGVIKINTNNTFNHELAKFLVCWELATNKNEFLTETIFINGRRADILNLDTCEAIEILHTEKEKNLINKTNNYPVKTIGLNATKTINTYLEKYLTEKKVKTK